MYNISMPIVLSTNKSMYLIFKVSQNICLHKISNLVLLSVKLNKYD